MPASLSLIVVTMAMALAADHDAVREEAAARIDTLLDPRIETREANGTVLVFQDGRQIYRRDIGMADFARQRPIDPRTSFRLASISKTFTAGAAMVLRSEERLRFPAPIADYLPEFPNGDQIRVFHLLVHSSGLGDVPDPPADRPYPSLDAAIAAFRSAPLAFAPGSSSRYSNAGYVLTARLVELVSHNSYETFLQNRFFRPLGMTGAHNAQTPSDPAGTRFYYPGPGSNGVVPAGHVDLSPSLGAGALVMTAADLMRWVEAVRTRRFFDIWAAEYPFGWGKRSYFGLDAVEQTGRNAGHSTSVVIIPDRELSVLCLFNVQSGFGLRCAKEVAAAVLDQPPPAPSLRLDLPRTRYSSQLGRTVEGRYRGNGWTLEIAVRNGALYYRFGERWLPVTPATETRLLLLPDSAMVTPRLDANGRMLGLDYRDGEQDLFLARVEAATAR